MMRYRKPFNIIVHLHEEEKMFKIFNNDTSRVALLNRIAP